MALHVRTIFASALADGGVSYSCAQITENINTPDCPTTLYAPVDRRHSERHYPAVTGLPQSLARIPYRLTSRLAVPLIEQRYLRDCVRDRANSIAYIWSEPSLSLLQKLHERGVTIVREKMNGSRRRAAQILREAFDGLGAHDAFDEHRYSLARAEQEEEEFRLSDYIYCPSPFVVQSLKEVGVPAEKLLLGTRGFDPQRLVDTGTTSLPPFDGTTFLFVGLAGVRKGVHILLEAWRQAKLKRARLVFLGGIEPFIVDRYKDVLASDSVVCVGHHANVAGFFAASDYFVLPSLEEGSPKVTYEAMACGLPCLVTSIGGGGVVRDGLDGHIVDTGAVADWAALLQNCDTASPLYRTQSDEVRRHAQDYTWPRVGAARREQFLGLAVNSYSTQRASA